MGATALLCDIGQSLEIVSEHTLSQSVNEFKMIVVPELSHGLEQDTLKTLLEYAKNGGRLVLIGSKTCEIFSQNGAPFKTEKINEFFTRTTMKQRTEIIGCISAFCGNLFK